MPELLIPALCASGGALAVIAWIRWQWRPRIVIGDNDRWTVHRDQAGKPHLQAELIHDMAERIPVGLFICDTRGHTVWCNPSAAAILGWTLPELVIGSFWTKIHPDDRPDSIDTVKDNIESPQVILAYKNRWIARDGSTRYVTWTASPFDEKGYSYCTVKLRHIEPRAEP